MAPLNLADVTAEDDVLAIARATPQQIYAAFCATFARELAELEKQS